MASLSLSVVEYLRAYSFVGARSVDRTLAVGAKGPQNDFFMRSGTCLCFPRVLCEMACLLSRLLAWTHFKVRFLGPNPGLVQWG